ncbi:hypothetical protein EJB05_14881, partial [Eragrostis curvula]
MGGSGKAADLWKEWGVQALVLFSFSLQVTLLVLAEFRHRVDSSVLRFFTWSAYQLADVTAIYVLGHMSVISRSPDHELLAFWAPFLLMHLGGQDNITSYAIEDNQLWLRHLQTFALQAAAAAYVIYVSSIFHSEPLLQAATIIMFVVGAVKYGERVWALRCASGSALGNNYQAIETSGDFDIHKILHPTSRSATEDILFLGHELLGVAKDFLKGPVPYSLKFVFWEDVGDDVSQELWGGREFHLDEDQAYDVAEMQVSLMYDVFHTKAESQCCCIRIVSSVGTAVALSLLFPLLSGGTSDRHNDGGYNRVDVVITYVLSMGAAVLEALSLLRFIFSSFNWYQYERKRKEQDLPIGCAARCLLWLVGGPNEESILRSIERLRDLKTRTGSLVITSLRRLVHAADRRRRHSWSRSMGQHNLLQVCARSKTNWSSKAARRMGVEDWWNTMASSWSVPVSPLIEQLVMKQVLESCDHIHSPQSQAAFEWKSQQQVYNDLHLSIDHDKLSLEESILAWHIATDLYLRWYKKNQPEATSGICKQQDELAQGVEALSNYMLFLVAARPHMLPPPANRNAYVQMCYILTVLKYSSSEDLADTLRRFGSALNTGSEFEFPVPSGGMSEFRWRSLDTNAALVVGCKLAAKLISGEESSAGSLELIGKLWAEMLCYVGNRCSAYAHAKQLSDGGELLTVAAFLVEYSKRDMIRASTDASLVPSEWTNDEEA